MFSVLATEYSEYIFVVKDNKPTKIRICEGATWHKAELMYTTTQYSSLIFQDEVLTHYWEDVLGEKKNPNQHLSLFKGHVRIIKSLAAEGDLPSFSIRKAISLF